MTGQRLTDSQRLDWLRLIRSQSVGPRTFRALVNQFGGARGALEALPDIARRSGAGSLRIASVADAEAELEALARAGARLVATGEPDYPRLLAAIDTAPPMIAIKGDPAVLARPAVAIVGARNASALGRRFAEVLARDLGASGLVLVSGLARGIDAAAHEAALPTGTVAVLAGGLNRIYPPDHQGLAGRIAEGGCLVSEMPINWTATGRDFPRRNRLVSGLSFGTIVVEAALRSGSLITARFANEQGREVFAVPGSPQDPRAEGTNRLIRQGATLITSAADVMESLAPIISSGELPPQRAEDGGEGEEPLWDELLGYGIAATAPKGSDTPDTASPPARDVDRLAMLLGAAPTPIDELARASGLPPRVVQAALLELELDGRLARHGQSRVSLLR